MRNTEIQKNTSRLAGELIFPGDKSLSHRAILFGSLAEGVSSFSNVLAGEDCLATRQAFETMGVDIRSSDPTRLEIRGRGLHSLVAPMKDLDCGNSGTSMRLLMGLLAGQPFKSTLTGDPSLSARPMRRVTDYLKQMGAGIEGRDGGNFAPITVQGGKLKGIDASLKVASAQVKSALLLAGLYAEGVTRVTEPVKSRDHTERFLKFFGARIEEAGLEVSIENGQKLKARNFAVAGDISSAAFFMAIAALTGDTGIQFKGVLWNPTRTGIVDVLKRAQVSIQVQNQREEGPEPVADFTLSSKALGAFEIQKNELPALIDEIPILMVLATQAEGTSVIHDAEELRLKETDRIESMATNLRKMGANIRVEGSTITITGRTPLRGAEVDSFKDHRTAMSMIVAGLIAEGRTTVRDTECINTSFPTFFSLLARIGAPLKQVNEV